MAELTHKKAQIKPFVWKHSLLKDDPLKAMQAEEKKEKNKPRPMLPEAATEKLRAKLKETLANGKETGLRGTRRDRNDRSHRSVPASTTAMQPSDPPKFDVTAKRLVRPFV